MKSPIVGGKMRDALKLAPLALVLFFTGIAAADTVTFDEIQLCSGTSCYTAMTGNEYAAYNLLVTKTLYVADTRFSDGHGISEVVGETPTINFIVPVEGLSIDWLSLDSSFFATAYDESGKVLSSFSAAPCGAVCGGTANLGGTDISKVVWHDDGANVAIDSMSFTKDPSVPESSSLVSMLGLGVGLLVSRIRHAVV